MIFELGLSMSQKMEHRLSQQEILEMRQKLGIQLAQKLSREMSNLLEISGQKQDANIEKALNDAIAIIEKEEVRNIAKGFKPLILEVLTNYANEVFAGRSGVSVVRVIHQTQGGMFPEEADGAILYKDEDDKIDLGSMIEAYENKEEFLNTVKVIEEQNKKPDSTASDAEKTEYVRKYNFVQMQKRAVAIVDSLRDVVSNIEGLIKVLVNKRIKDRGLVRDTIVDNLFAHELIRTEVLSDRIRDKLKRTLSAETTSSAIRKANKTGKIHTDTLSRLHHAFTNAWGQMILVGLGVIDKDLFVVQRAGTVDIDDQDVREKIRNEFKEDPSHLLQRHNLTNKQQFFYFSRYNTKFTPPTTETDNLIRDFITKIVREDGDLYLGVSECDRRIFELFKQLNTGEKRDTAESDIDCLITGAIEDILLSDKVIEEIKNKIKSEYYSKIASILNA